MGLFDTIGYFLSGSDIGKNSGKAKSVQQIRKDAVTFSNASYNASIRDILKVIDEPYLYEMYIPIGRNYCAEKLKLVDSQIQAAQKKAAFNEGTFQMESDVKQKYAKLLKLVEEIDNKILEQKHIIEEQREKKDYEQQEAKLAAEREEQDRREEWNQAYELQRKSLLLKELRNRSLQYRDYEKVDNPEPIEKEKELDIFLHKCKEKYLGSGFEDVIVTITNHSVSIEYSRYKKKYVFKVYIKTLDDMQREVSVLHRNVQNMILDLIYIEEFHQNEIETFIRSKSFSLLKFQTKKPEHIAGEVKYQNIKLLFSYKVLKDTEELKATNDELDFDNMDGHSFEYFCAGLLKKNGYTSVSVTSGSGDQGIDIIAYRDSIKYGIQCKCYASDVGNKAVQEVFAGKTFYQCHVGIVLTNRFFTKSAIELANRNGIVLWDRKILIDMIKKGNQ